MVLGIRSRSKKASSIQVDYIIHLQEIKPWPPSQSSKAQAPVILHWESGDKHSGSMRSNIPQIGPDYGDGKIVFNESFLLPASLLRESSTKDSKLADNEKFQKKRLELNLYETKNERTVKGQLLGSAVVDLAEYGVPKNTISTSVPLNLKRGSRNAAQVFLFLSIAPYGKNIAAYGFDTERANVANASASPSSRDSLSNATSLDKDTRDSIIAALMSDEDAEEAEIASFTDDESSSRSLSPSTSASEAKVNSPFTKSEPTMDVQQIVEENLPEAVETSKERVQKVLITSAEALPVKTAAAAAAAAYASKRVPSSRDGFSSRASSTDLSSDPDSPENNDIFMYGSSETRSSLLSARSPVVPRINSSSTSPSSKCLNREGGNLIVAKSTDRKKALLEVNVEEKKLVEKDGIKETGVKLVHNTHAENNDRKNERRKETEEIKVNETNNASHISTKKELQEVSGEEKNYKQAVAELVPNQTQKELIREELFEQNDEKHEDETNFMHYENKELELKQSTRAREVEYKVEEEIVERQTGGIRATELSDYKVAQLTKVTAKEGNNQSVETGPRVAKANMEKQTGGKQVSKSCRDPPRKVAKVGTEVRNGGKGSAVSRAKSLQDNKPKNLKVPVKSISDLSTNLMEELDDKFIEEVKEISISEAPSGKVGNSAADETNGKSEERTPKEPKVKVVSAEARATIVDEKVKQMELKIEKLEGELREAAAIEAALYTVAAEHGSSSHKVHSPARRLARLYIHACKHWSQDRRAGAARNAASGLILAAKACGNDVPRLTFWWSNTVVLREIVTQAFDSSQVSPQASSITGSNSARKNQRLHSPQNLRNSFSKQGRQKLSLKENLIDWQEMHTFTTALEKIESWIYGRVIESVWWQTLTPYMQCPAEDAIREHKGLYSRKSFGKLLGPELGDRQQGKFSIDLWKKAFLDAFQRICPVRAGGHECGCLPILAKMVMEQCIARLDVAMFNAILRESAEDMPTDPVSDPISDPNVLPIPAGKLSFGAGAQLKNAVGNWSRWLTDLFGIDIEDSPREGCKPQEDDIEDGKTTFSSFSLLNATSDLLMLPKDMLMDKSIRKEVCPVLSLPLIKRVLYNFVPDEFCPDPVPPLLLEALNVEIPLERPLQGEEDSLYSSVFSAPPVQYFPPPAASVRERIGDANNYIHVGRNVSCVLRKGYTSDDELDELESPLSLLLENVPSTSPQMNTSHSNGKSGQTVKQPTDNAGLNIRYNLLRDVWAEK
eukprot:Gb_21265 [translate_table: standard]